MLVYKNSERRQGFTIVELLIVIVAIAILATISIIAYNETQSRARNTVRVATAKQALDAVTIMYLRTNYTQIRSTLNKKDSWYSACIGTGYADINGDGLGDCSAYKGSVSVSESTDFNNLLKDKATPINGAKFPTLATDDYALHGPYLQSAWVDGKNELVMEYVLEGEKRDCMLRPVVYYSPSSSMTTASPAPKWSVSAYGTTECMILIQ